MRNGADTNASVAPTSFMISISSRRAKTASRSVLETSTAVASARRGEEHERRDARPARRARSSFSSQALP